MNLKQFGGGLASKARQFGSNIKTFVRNYNPNVTGLRLSGHRLASSMLHNSNPSAYVKSVRSDRAYLNRLTTQAKAGTMVFINNLKQLRSVLSKGLNFVIHKSQLPRVARFLGMKIDDLRAAGKIISYRGKYYKTISKGQNILFKINSGLNLVADTVYGINDANYTMRTKPSGKRVQIRGKTKIGRKVNYQAGRTLVKSAVVAGTAGLINYGIKGIMSGDSKQEN